jgi:hypothetical protein
MSAISQLLLLARIYRESTGLKSVTLSWRLFGDSKKLAAIENGADIQVTRYERALQWFSDNWPDQAWPADAGPRPPRSVASDPSPLTEEAAA